MSLKNKDLDCQRELSVGICLAAYNGQAFIREQITSILSQTVGFDELVVIDDCSTDGTISLLENLRTDKIQISISDKNKGHVVVFEEALGKITADIVFFSDQDDLWDATKIETVKKYFQSDESIVLVHHDLRFIDEAGNLLPNGVRLCSYGKQNRIWYLFRQLLRPQLFGCGIAIRREIIEFLTPFPRSVYAHDHWVALVGGVFGQVVFLEDELTFYRQHRGNLTPKQRRPFHKVILSRLRLAILLHIAIVRKVKSWRLRRGMMSS